LCCDFRFGNQQVVSGDQSGWVRLWHCDVDSLGWTRRNLHECFGAENEPDAGGAGFVGDDFVYIDWARRSNELLVFRAHEGQAMFSELPPSSSSESGFQRLGRPLRVGDEVWRAWSTGWQHLHVTPDFVSPNWQERQIPFARNAVDGGPLAVHKDAADGSLSLFTKDLKKIVRIPGVFRSRPVAGEAAEIVSSSSNDGRWLALRSPEGLRLFRLGREPKEVALEMSGLPPPSSICDVAFSPGGEYMAAIFDDDCTIAVWSTAAGARHSTMYGRGRKLWRCAVTANGERVLALERDTGRVNLWDSLRGAHLGSFAVGPPGDGFAFELDGKGRRLLVGLRRRGRALIDADGDSVRLIQLAK